jgi:hypothetical protein
MTTLRFHDTFAHIKSQSEVMMTGKHRSRSWKFPLQLWLELKLRFEGLRRASTSEEGIRSRLILQLMIYVQLMSHSALL